MLVADRFSNPYIEHLWTSITLQYTMKMKIRILPLLSRYYEVFQKVPHHMAFGFAAYMRFMHISHESGGQYFGQFHQIEYVINDDHAAFFYKNAQLPDEGYIQAILSNTDLWGLDLTAFPGFEATVLEYFTRMAEPNILQCLNSLYINPCS